MENKDKYFFLGFALGFVIPFLESSIKSAADPNLISLFGKMLVLTGSIWQYIFLYLVALFTFILYFKKLRDKINPESRFVFLISGVALGFAIISIISVTIDLIS